MTSLNLVLPIVFQVAEAIYVHDPALLARRFLSRSIATPALLKELMALLMATHCDEASLRKFAAEHGLAGIEEQALCIWNRSDIHISRKAEAISALSEAPVNRAGLKISERLARPGAIPPPYDRVP